ncbi:hypothetical protein Tco_0174241 [Tanacetum coccineum]
MLEVVEVLLEEVVEVLLEEVKLESSSRHLVDNDVKEVSDLSLEEIEGDEVALVDGIFEGAFSALGDESWCLGLEVEALVDVMEVMVVDDK